MTLAVARVTRLITTDDVTRPWRSRLARRHPPTGGVTWPVRLVNCDWCVGVWLAAIAAPLGKLSHLVPTWPWAAWAFVGMAGGSGLLLTWQGDR